MKEISSKKMLRSLFLITLINFCFGIFPLGFWAQKSYIGEPVTKTGLIKAMKMRQFKTSALVLVNSAFDQTDSIVYFPNKGQNANAIGKSFTKNDAYRAKNNQEFDNSDKRIKLFN